MRILQLIDAPRRRGAEVFASQLTRGLQDRGHEVSLIAMRSAIGGENELGVDATLGAGVGRGPSWSAARKMADLARLMDADIVQANGGSTPKHASLAKAIDRRAGWKLVYRNIGDPRFWLSNPVQRAYYRYFVWSRLDGVLSVSEHAKRGLREVYGDGGPPVEVIYQGVEPATLEPEMTRAEIRCRLATPESSVVVVWIGALSREKRPDRALRVISRMKSQAEPVVLWVVGAGPMERELVAVVRDLGVSDSVRWVGPVNDVGTYLHASDVFLLTSDTEGVPGALLEAMMVGLPCVVTDVGGISEVVEDGRTGFLRQAEDETGLAACLEHLDGAPGLRSSMGADARMAAEKEFSMARCVSNHEAFYHSTLNDSREHG